MISVLFSSYNGVRTLPVMLKRLIEIEPPVGGWEILAVDNGSTDGTSHLLQEATPELPLRCLQHPDRGKNKALNAAVAKANGDLLVFTDDDVLPARNWLRVLEDAASDFPEYDIFGGSIIADWARPPEQWILEHVPLGVTYAITDPDLARGDVYPGLIWGANMMVRRRVFDLGLRFNEAVGPSGGQYAMGSETGFNLRAAAAGHRCYFEPRAVVAHMIRDFQMERKWIIGRAYRFGRNMWNQEYAEGATGQFSTILGMPRWRFRKYVDHRVQALLAACRGDPENAFRHDWEVGFLRGYFAQWWTQW